MSSDVRRALAQFFITLGLAVAAFLALVKFFALPCPGSGGCHTILHSSFGTVFRVPLGVYGALLWLAVVYVPDRSKRGALLLLLATGCAGLMIVQFVVLRGFCAYCTLHAGAAFGALWLHGEKPSRWTAPIGLGLACAGLLAARHHAAAQAAILSPAVPAQTPAEAASLHAGPGLYWLGAFDEKSPALVLSIDCPACLDLLETLTQRSYAGTRTGPALYFKTTDANREATAIFVAAVLAQEQPPRDAFLAAATLLLTQKDSLLASPATAASTVAALFPEAPGRLTHAERILADHGAALRRSGVSETTPLLVPRTGKPKAFFGVEDLFGVLPSESPDP